MSSGTLNCSVMRALAARLAHDEDDLLHFSVQINVLHHDAAIRPLWMREKSQQLFNHVRQALYLVVDYGQAAHDRAAVVDRVAQGHGFAPALNGRQRRAQFVRDGGDEVVFHFIVLGKLGGHVVD